MTRALLLSGGAGHGSFQIGALEEIGEAGEIYYKTIRGNSVGAFNGAVIAQHEPATQRFAPAELRHLWAQEVKGSASIYNKRFAGGIGAVIEGSQGLYDPSPLLQIVKRNWKKAAPGVDFAVGAVDAITGEYMEYDSSREDFAECIVHSARFPVAFDPGTLVERNKNGVRIREQWLVDGGVRFILPCASVIEDPEITEIDAILCQPEKGGVLPWSPGKRYSLLEYALRNAEIMADQILRSNVFMLKQWAKERKNKLRIFAPKTPITTDPLAFRPSDTDVLANYGRLCAREVLRGSA